MKVDLTTLHELGILGKKDTILQLIDLSKTNKGSDFIRSMITHPPLHAEAVKLRQEGIRFWMQHISSFPNQCTNGTLIMIDDFFKSGDSIGYRPKPWLVIIDTLIQKIVKKKAFSFEKFAINHIRDLLLSIQAIHNLSGNQVPLIFEKEFHLFQELLSNELVQAVLQLNTQSTNHKLLKLTFEVRRNIKHTISQAIEAFCKLEAYHSLAQFTITNNWVIPEVKESSHQIFEGKNIYHPLLKQGIPYDFILNKSKNFLFLTGANMSGKSTFMRTLGILAVLSHAGMSVPASQFSISFLNNIISNMHVEDDLIKGESYFLAEVRRVKSTVQQLILQPYNLILMDELFKGTNIHDAYDCSKAVITGLSQHSKNLFILSTHLYELETEIQKHNNIDARYFETKLNSNNEFKFTYQLKQGISKDRIGYLVLVKEKVIELLGKTIF